MSQLKPCPHCQRHIKQSESACPFCAQPVPADFASPRARVRPETRLGRAATFVLGLGVIAPTAACKDDSSAKNDAGTSADSSVSDASTGHDAAAAVDAGGQDAASDAATHDAGTDADAGSEDSEVDSGFIPIYAAAPSPDDGSRLADQLITPGTRRS